METEPKLKKFAFYNLVILLITVQLVVVLNYWYFVFKNIGQASINDTIAYQGKLVDSGGSAVPDGDYNMQFSVYSAATGGTPIWTERWDGTLQNGHPGSQVAVANGIFSVELNSLCSDWVSGTCAADGGVDFSSNSLYLEVQFDADSNTTMDQIFTPRKRFSSVAYAMNAAKLDGYPVGTSGDAVPLLSGNNTLSGSLTTSGAVIMNVADSNLDGLKIVSNQALDMSNPPLSLFSKKVSSWYAGSTMLGAIYPFGSIQSLPTTGFPAFVVGTFPAPDPNEIYLGLYSSAGMSIDSQGGKTIFNNPAQGYSGEVGINVNPTDTLEVGIKDASLKGLRIIGANGQSGDFVDIQDDLGNSFVKINATGTLISAVPEGTAPITVTSTTLATNLNADLLDGIDSTGVVLKVGDTMSGNLTIADNASALNSGAYTFSMMSSSPLAGAAPTTPSTGDAGIVSYWKFDEGSGITAADAVGGRNLNTTNVTWNGAGAFGYSGDASISVNGSGQNITLTHDSGLSSADISVYAWVKTTDTGSFRGVIDKGWSNGGYVMQLRNGYASFDTQGPTGTFYTCTGTTFLADDQWHMIVGTFDSATQELKVYVDGILENTVYGAQMGSNSLNPVIGGDGASTFHLSGSIDNLIIYNTARNSTEISTDHTNGITAVPGNGVAFSADTTNAYTDAEKIFTWKTAGSEKAFLSGTGGLYINSIVDSANAEQITFTSTASAVNFLTVTNGATGTAPVFSADGETNVGLTIKPKGTGSVTIPSQSATAIPLIVKGAASQSSNIFEVQESDSDILFAIQPDGTISTASNTKVTNLNADLLDGYDSGYFTSVADGKLSKAGDSMNGLLTQKAVTQTDSVFSTGTVTVSQGGNAYVLTADSGSTSASVTTTYDITGVPDSAGNRFTLDLRVKKGDTNPDLYTHTIAVKINGTLIPSISFSTSGSGAGEVSHGYDFKWNPFTSAWIVTTLY